MKSQTTLIIGANSGIAKALAVETNKSTNDSLVVITRDISFYENIQFNNCTIIKVNDYQESSMVNAIKLLKEKNRHLITKIFICHGLLHGLVNGKIVTPEKRLQAFNADNFNEVFNANTITPILWLKNLVPYVSGKHDCKIVLFNARVGSIADNKLGGWYSYRASKAAINMLIKTTAIELSRTAKNIKLISFHPGTTDTPLSKPFQKNVPENKLFTCGFVAQQLLEIIKSSKIDGEASFLDWQGNTIPW